MYASADDWHMYRRTRTGSTLEERLAAAEAYLERRPPGAWRVEVREWFSTTERAYYGSSNRTAPELRAYLDTLPHGPHARDAIARLEEFEISARYARRRDERLTDEARELEERLGDAQRMRRDLVLALASWVRWLSEITSWGRPTSELDDSLLAEIRRLPHVKAAQQVSL